MQRVPRFRLGWFRCDIVLAGIRVNPRLLQHLLLVFGIHMHELNKFLFQIFKNLFVVLINIQWLFHNDFLLVIRSFSLKLVLLEFFLRHFSKPTSSSRRWAWELLRVFVGRNDRGFKLLALSDCLTFVRGFLTRSQLVWFVRSQHCVFLVAVWRLFRHDDLILFWIFVQGEGRLMHHVWAREAVTRATVLLFLEVLAHCRHLHSFWILLLTWGYIGETAHCLLQLHYLTIDYVLISFI